MALNASTSDAVKHRSKMNFDRCRRIKNFQIRFLQKIKRKSTKESQTIFSINIWSNWCWSGCFPSLKSGWRVETLSTNWRGSNNNGSVELADAGEWIRWNKLSKYGITDRCAVSWLRSFSLVVSLRRKDDNVEIDNKHCSNKLI